MSRTNNTLHDDNDPCLNCGACCASFRVSFYWAETKIYAIPEHAIEQLTPAYACMA